MLTLHDCVSEACNAATFKLLLDGVVIVAACRRTPSVSAGGPTDMAIEMLRSRPAGEPPKGVKWRRKGSSDQTVFHDSSGPELIAQIPLYD